MSYILDALRKAQEEKTREQAARSREFRLPVRRAAPPASRLAFVAAAAALGAALAAAVYLFTAGGREAAAPLGQTPETVAEKINGTETAYPPVKQSPDVKQAAVKQEADVKRADVKQADVNRETDVNRGAAEKQAAPPKPDTNPAKKEAVSKRETAVRAASGSNAPPRRTRTAGSFEGRVTGVIDGCLIEVESAGGPVRVALRGVRCEDKNTPSGRAAKQFTAAAVFSKTVRVVSARQVGDQMVEADVFSSDGSMHLNKILVSGGVAEAVGGEQAE
jgi:outer membrane biosynthesis protein TonB